MLTNADITIYNLAHKGTRNEKWVRTQIQGVEWYGGQAVSIGDKGLNTADTYTVRIPASSAPQDKEFLLPEDYSVKDNDVLNGFWTLQPGDIVVRGLMDDEITKSTDVTAKHSQYFIVTGWRDNRRGSPIVQHWRIDGK